VCLLTVSGIDLVMVRCIGILTVSGIDLVMLRGIDPVMLRGIDLIIGIDLITVSGRRVNDEWH
jgi:hypothetical protein